MEMPAFWGFAQLQNTVPRNTALRYLQNWKDIYINFKTIVRGVEVLLGKT